MAIPDKWKQAPLQAKKEEKKMSEEELVAKLLNTGLARSAMEAKQMAKSMTHIEKTQKQFEQEIRRIESAPRVAKPAMAQEMVNTTSDAVHGDSGTQVVVEGIGKSQSLLLSELNSLKDHVARQQQTIERLEQDVAFIRTLLQNKKPTDEAHYPRTPTAAELLEAQEKADPSRADADIKPSDLEEDDSFIAPNK